MGEKGVAAAICRDGAGVFLGASIVVMAGLTDPTTLEALACSEALALAEDLHLRNLTIASDSYQVVRDIKNEAFPSYVAILREIKHTSLNFDSVSFCFEFRESNFEAHSLAKGASTLSVGRHVWLGITPDIACISNLMNIQ